MHDTLKREMANPELVIKDIKELAHQLYLNVSLSLTFGMGILAKLID